MTDELHVPQNTVRIKWDTREDKGTVILNGEDLSSTVSGVSFDIDRTTMNRTDVPVVNLKVCVTGVLDVELDGVEVRK